MAKISYITFDELMASVESDLQNYADNGMINRGTCIKVVRKVNETLGLKINKEKELVLKVKNYLADLPDDFFNLQLALVCGTTKEYFMPDSFLGTHTEEHNSSVVLDCKNESKSCLNENGGTFWVTQQLKNKTVKQTSLFPILLSNKSLKFCSDNCVNFNFKKSPYSIDIENDQIVANFREGEIYINYLSDMIDEEGNILILDHPMVTPFYEYSVKKHLFENFLLNNDADVLQRWQLLKQELKEAKYEAMNFVNTIEYTEIQETFKANRKRFYNKYHRMFYDYNY